MNRKSHLFFVFELGIHQTIRISRNLFGRLNFVSMICFTSVLLETWIGVILFCCSRNRNRNDNEDRRLERGSRFDGGGGVIIGKWSHSFRFNFCLCSKHQHHLLQQDCHLLQIILSMMKPKFKIFLQI